MLSLADGLNALAAERYYSLSDEQRVEIHDVLDAATEFAEGTLPVHEFAKVGTLPSRKGRAPSSGYTRFLALMTTPRGDERREHLLKAINAVLLYQGYVVTTQGVWTPQDLGSESSMGSMRVHPAQEVDPWAA